MGSHALSDEDIHDVLRNRRRRLVLELLQANGGEATARELSEHIATVESGENPPPRKVRQSAYVSLHQTHLPKLNKLDIIEYDEQAKTVNLNDRHGELSVYLETVPRYGLSWSEFYIGVGILAILTVVGASMDVPVLSAVRPLHWALLFFFVVIAAGGVHTYQQGSSILTRLRN